MRLICLTLLPGSPTSSKGSASSGVPTNSVGLGRIPPPRSAPCPRKRRHGGSQNERPWQEERLGETRVQVPRLSDVPAGGARGAAARWLRPVYNAALEERREAWRMGQHSITYGMQSGQLGMAKPTLGGQGRHSFTAAANASRRLNARLRARSEGEGGYPRFKPYSRFDQVGFVVGDGAKWTPRPLCRRMGTGSIPGRWLGQGPPAPARPRDGQVPATQTRVPALVRHRHQRHRGRSAPSQRP